VVHHDDQILVALLVGDLVDADAPEVLEGILGGPGVGDHPGDDGADGAPGDPHELAHGRLRAVRRQPGHLVVEGMGVAGAVAGPGTEATTTPWVLQVTLGASASRYALIVPRSRLRHRRRPSPLS
jgi:hypothetical protein